MHNIGAFVKKIKNPYLLKFFNFALYLLLVPVRAGIAGRYLTPSIRLAVKWLFNSRETSNFSYDLSGLNRDYLAYTVSVVTGQSIKKIRGYIQEVEMNRSLRAHLARGYKTSPFNFMEGPLIAYGRRVGWYAVVRAIKPEVVVETGVDQGLGSCILVEALRKNIKEGRKGKYFGTDILPEAGALFTGEYKKYGDILYGDSLKSLEKFDRKIDLFINDSDHHSGYESREYNIVSRLLKPDSFILGDNSHGSVALSEFAEKTNRNFLFFKEEPKNHWYPGAGIGFAYGKNIT